MKLVHSTSDGGLAMSCYSAAKNNAALKHLRSHKHVYQSIPRGQTPDHGPKDTTIPNNMLRS